MTINNCKNCKRMFNYQRGPILCSKCDEELFSKLKEYLILNENATISEISESTDISISIIKDFIKDDRLIELRSSSINVCSSCGNVINGDSKYCIDCLNKIKISMELENLYKNKVNEKKEQARMRYFSVKRKN